MAKTLTLADVVSHFELKLSANPNLRIESYIERLSKSLNESAKAHVVDSLIPIEIVHRLELGLPVHIVDYQSLSKKAASIAESSLKNSLGMAVLRFKRQWNNHLAAGNKDRPEHVKLKTCLLQIDKKYRGRLFQQLVEHEIKHLKSIGIAVSKTDYESFGNSAVQMVEKIIRQHDSQTNANEDEFSTKPDVEARNSTATGFGSGEMIEQYKLVMPIGKGGMGQVWLAEQQRPVRREVALKLIRAEIVNRQMVARFEAERQALAMMDHPNITKVIGGGETKDKLPYYVMELVNGKSIIRFCDHNKLAIEERLALFTKVCQAINHAHSKHIIHRDLKPENILVTTYDDQPVPKVLDFGLAKTTIQSTLTDKTVHTKLGQLLGTPRYMSPEQADLGSTPIDEKTDIYALGIILFELVVGSTPISMLDLDQLSLVEVLAKIRRTPPPSLSKRLSDSQKTVNSIAANRATDVVKLQSIVSSQLNAIVQKACAIDPNQRYSSGRKLANAISNLNFDDLDRCPTHVEQHHEPPANNRSQIKTSKSQTSRTVDPVVGKQTWREPADIQYTYSQYIFNVSVMGLLVLGLVAFLFWVLRP